MLKQSFSDGQGMPNIGVIGNIHYPDIQVRQAKRLHILLVTETWLPEVNGVAMSLGQLMHQLNLKGHQISLLRPKPSHSSTVYAAEMPIKSPNSTQSNNSESYLKVMQHIKHDLQVKGMSIPKYKELQFGAPEYFKIKKKFQQLQPDVVHIATEGPLGFAALWAAKSLNIPVTTGYHTQFHDFSRHFGLGILARPMMAYFKWFHNASQATCVPSQKTFNDLNSLGFKRLYEVGRGVDLERFNATHRSEKLRAEWGAHSHHTVLLMVSRLSPEKGVDLVIESFKVLQREQLQRVVKLVIVGDGPDKERLESLAAGNKEDIIFAGAKTGQSLSEHYASADVFVFASQVETFGNVVVEAMASGLPVYAFDDAAAGMLVTERSGVLVSFGDKKEFVEKVANLPKMQVLKEQGAEAAKSVAGFSWQRPADQMLTMFYDAIHHSELSH
ncbi:glycosyltransferase family 4 protein [Psychrobacter phenylpyruvicus]|uniref:GDP-mannose-dependent alpha-mannosyltransferase n=1 Tax=Psychrobacter phenylpyruvicus TaxID=29432 RepID=A0A379LKR7_9GAMM|nr:glycosyltransferase family 1 protein [Psychrobacter phenylpyruvicus]SUD91031.1 GDP-mannose-dependent alpha-mannosyltransferase [Psychrobacter phenylpyruvicus]